MHKKQPSCLTENGRQFKYFAFISYKHKDKRWARWLQHQLETYRLPNRLCAEDRPKRLSPIFRDETDLTGGGSVQKLLDQHLGACKFLIVICSRNMQHNPEYINFEISRFLEYGNPVTHVLPFIVDGEGCAADPANEALPPALLDMGEDRPLGITMDKDRKHEAVLKLVAAMHGIDLQSIRDHDHDRRQKRILAAMGAGLAVSVALGSFMAWEALSVKQAQLREQNAYAAVTMEKGDRLRAEQMVDTVLEQVNLLMAEDIAAEAEKLRLPAAIQPVLSPMTLLEEVRGDKKAAFDLTGQQVIISTEDRVRLYGLDGQLSAEYTVDGLGQKFVAVSPDGARAVTLALFEDGQSVTLWLCSLPEGKRITQLASSDSFDKQDKSAGHYDTVLDAAFSPDGSLVSACRIGGYFNASSTLEAFNAKTGEQVVALDASLLGDDGHGNAIVQEFGFVSNTLLQWKGSTYQVLYDVQTGKTYQISLANLIVSKEKGMHAYGHLQMLAAGNDEGQNFAAICDLAEGQWELFEVPEGGLSGDSCFIGRHFAIVAGTNAKGEIIQVDLVDTRTMQSRSLLEKSGRYEKMYVYPSPGEKAYTLCLINARPLGKDLLVRFDPETSASASYYTALGSMEQPLVFAGAHGGADWLIASDGKKTEALRLADGQVSRYRLEESYQVFSQGAQISELSGMLLANHNGSYALYRMAEPGRQADEGISWDQEAEARYAASAAGTIILKAQGKRIAAFDETGCLWEQEMAHNVLAADVSADGQRVVFADYETIRLCSADGTVLSEIPTGEERLKALRITADGRRIAVARELPNNTVLRVYTARLTLYDGEALTEVAELNQAVYCGTGDAPPAFDLSPDGKHIATVALIGHDNGALRVATLVDAETGALLAVTNNYGEPTQAATLDVTGNLAQAHDFTYVTFSGRGEMLAGLSSGVWRFDPQALGTIGFVPAAQTVEGTPLQLPSGDILYPAGDVRVLSHETGALKARMAADGFKDMQLSPDGKWLLLNDQTGARLISMVDFMTTGQVSNGPIQIVLMDSDRIVYDTEHGLFILDTTDTKGGK